MSIIDNPVAKEILDIIGGGPKDAHFRWWCQIHANGKTLSPHRLLSVDINRDYVANFTDQVILELTMPEGDFDDGVFPYRENLVVTLFQEPTVELSDHAAAGDQLRVQRYRATLFKSESKEMQADTPHDTDKETKNLKNMKTFSLQLLDLSIEQIRLMATGGIFRNVTTAEVARYLLGSLSGSVRVEKQFKPKGVDIAPNANPRVYNHVIVPHHTRLTRVVPHLQEYAHGLFSAGVGQYYQGRVWYVYPPYDIKRHENARQTLTVLNVPSNLIPGVERTFRVQDNTVFVLSTGEVQHRDESDKLQQNHGNAVRYGNADALWEEPGLVKDNRFIMTREDNNVEISVVRRDSDMDHTALSAERITSNHGFQLSKLAVRNGAYVQFTWENANTRLIKPGMAVRFLYPVKKKLKQVYGCVVGAEYVAEWKGETLTQGKYITTAVVTLFVQRQPEEV